MRPIAFVAALLASSTAFGGIFAGSPDPSFRIVRPTDDLLGGTVEIAAVHIHHCDGQVATYPVDETIDPVKGFQLSIDGGDLCHAEIEWSSPTYLLGPKFTLKADTSSTVVSFQHGATTDLTNLQVAAGLLPQPELAPRLELLLD